MIKEVSYPQTVGHAVFKNHKNVNPTNPGMQYSDTSGQNFAKMSAENLKANFVSFAGTKNVSFKGGGNVSNLPALRTVSEYASTDNFYKGKYYDALVDDMAIAMGADNSVILKKEDDVNTQLLIQNFKKNLKEGRYDRQGLRADNTDVEVIDAKILNAKNQSSFGVLKRIADRAILKKKVVFVDDVNHLLQDCLGKEGTGIEGLTIDDILKSDTFMNLRIVGMMNNNLYNDIARGKGEERLAPLKLIGLTPNTVRNVVALDFNGTGVADTKKLLKDDSRFTNQVLKKFHDKNITVSGGAIDSIVDRSSVTIKGCFPDKALRVLDLVVTAKLNGMKNYKYGQTVNISAKDVENLFNDHMELVESLKDFDAKFQFAENVKTRFSDVGGVGEAKEEMQDLVEFLKDPKKYLATGKAVPKGRLMEGPGGTGKTLLARAVAGEGGVPFISATGSDFVEKYVGVGAARVRALFDKARKAALASENKIAVVFIDEIDAIGKQRGNSANSGNDEREATLNQLLTEMDGFNNKESKVKVVVLAATNRADLLDKALVRPGRFDSSTTVNQVTVADRLEILNIHAKNKKFASEAEKAKILKDIAENTNRMTGAELKDLMDKAAVEVLKRTENKFITYADLFEAMLQVQSGKKVKSEISEADKRLVVAHEWGHAVAIDFLKESKVTMISNEARGRALGTTYYQPSKKSIIGFSEIVKDAISAYAGGFAEMAYHGKGHGTGVSGDFDHISHRIEDSIKRGGMGIYTPQISFLDHEGNERKDLVEMYSKEIRKDVELYTKLSQKATKLIIEFQKDFLHNVYLKAYDAEVEAGKGGNVLTGEEFAKMRNEWLTNTNREKAEENLKKKIDAMIEKVRTINTPKARAIRASKYAAAAAAVGGVFAYGVKKAFSHKAEV